MTLGPELITFFTAMLPFLEIKLAVPLGRELGLSTTSAILFAVSGSIIPAAITLAVIGPLSKYLGKKSTYIKKFFEKLFKKTQTDHSKNFNRYGALLLITIVAVPLPGSGTVTSSLIAFIFGVDYWKALSLVSLGAICSGILINAGFASMFAIINLFA